MLLDGEDVEAEIRGSAVTRAVSAVSAMPQVRAALVEHQREPHRGHRGRSSWRAATSARSSAPDAPLKVYLTASEEVRAARRAGAGPQGRAHR